jgi:hypothetical protein
LAPLLVQPFHHPERAFLDQFRSHPLNFGPVDLVLREEPELGVANISAQTRSLKRRWDELWNWMPMRLRKKA